jgi:hypothetical protein
MKTTIELAREAGDDWDSTLSTDKEFLRRFEALIRADESEVCAQVVEEYPHWLGMTAKAEIANAIRNRGNT